MKRALWFVLLLCFTAGAVAQTNTPTSTRTPTATVTPTKTPTPTKTNTPISPRNSQPNIVVPYTAANAITAGHFVSYDRQQAIAGSAVAGVALQTLTTGKNGTMVTAGRAEVLAGGTLHPGDPVKSDGSGAAILASVGDAIVGIVQYTRTDGSTTVAGIILAPGGTAAATVTPRATLTSTNTPTPVPTPTRTPTIG